MSNLIFLLFEFFSHGFLYRPYQVAEVGLVGSHIVTAPFEMHQLFLFDLDGKFVQALGKRGQGPGEFEVVHLSGMLKDRIWAVSGRNPTHVYELDLTGQLAGEYPIAPLKVRGWPYRVSSGWVLQRYEGESLSFYTADPLFRDESKILQIPTPVSTGPDDVVGKRIMWCISRDRMAFFYADPSKQELLVVDLVSGLKTNVDLKDKLQAIPDLDSEKNLWGKRESLPVFSDLKIGPGNLCLIYTAAHQLHPESPPLIYDGTGKMVSMDFSAETWRRLVEIRGEYAWVLTFNEDDGAGVQKVKVAEVDHFTEKTRYEFSHEDFLEYLKTRIRRP